MYRSKVPPLPPVTEDFKKFIRGMLKLGDIRKDHLDAFTNEESMRNFRVAFTHPSYNPYLNYEKMEFVGDGAIYICVIEYIVDKYPEITNVNWISRMKHTFISKKYLGKIAEKHGFFKYIVLGEQAKEIMAKERAQNLHNVYEDMMEDTVEAFLGAVRLAVLSCKLPFGVYVAFAKRLVFKFLDEMNIDPYDYRLYFDNISLLKEVYDSNHWTFGRGNIRYGYNQDTKEWKITFVTYPLNNHAPVRSNAVEFSAEGFNKKKVKNKAAENALEGLRKYNINIVPPDPRASNPWKKKMYLEAL